MKRLIYSTLFLLAIAGTSCKKSDSLADLFTGKWQMVATANAGNFDPANNLYVRFNNDGSLRGTAFPAYTGYRVDATAKTLTLTGASSMIYSYSFAGNQLVLTIPNALIDNYIKFEKVQ